MNASWSQYVVSRQLVTITYAEFHFKHIATCVTLALVYYTTANAIVFPIVLQMALKNGRIRQNAE